MPEELLLLLEELVLSDPPLPAVPFGCGSSLQPVMKAVAPTRLMRIAYFMKKPPVQAIETYSRRP
jgi:hypothetical protein